MYLFWYLVVYPFFCLSVNRSQYPYLSFSLSLDLSSQYLYISLPISLTVCLSTYLSLHLSLHLSLSLSPSPSLSLSIHPSIYLQYLSERKQLCETSKKKWKLTKLTGPIPSNSARPPQRMEVHTKRFCETSTEFEVDNIRNEAILQDILQKWYVQFLISHPIRQLCTVALRSLLFDPLEPQNCGENTVFRDCSTFSRTLIVFLLTLSSLTLPTTAAASVHRSEVWLLNVLRWLFLMTIYTQIW